MKKGFWDKLPRPFYVLAPLSDVTDAAFRRIIAKYGSPDVMYTEFVSADGLVLADKKGRSILMKDLMYTEDERPIVAQFFTARPDMMKRAAKIAAELGFDGIDINMGCPDRSVEKQGAGAALMKNPELAVEIIKAAYEGAGDLPISIKTRIGYNKNELSEWLPALLSAEPSAVILHGRTRKEMSKVPAHWDSIKEAVDIRDKSKSKTLIIGNGDVVSIEDAKQKVKDTGCDGVMLGRAVFGNPYLFAYSRELESKDNPKVIRKILMIMLEHTKLFEELFGDIKNFAVMKKHYKAYVNDFKGAKELRIKLMETKNAKEVEEIVNQFLK